MTQIEPESDKSRAPVFFRTSVLSLRVRLPDTTHVISPRIFGSENINGGAINTALRDFQRLSQCCIGASSDFRQTDSLGLKTLLVKYTQIAYI